MFCFLDKLISLFRSDSCTSDPFSSVVCDFPRLANTFSSLRLRVSNAHSDRQRRGNMSQSAFSFSGMKFLLYPVVRGRFPSSSLSSSTRQCSFSFSTISLWGAISSVLSVSCRRGKQDKENAALQHFLTSVLCSHVRTYVPSPKKLLKIGRDLALM